MERGDEPADTWGFVCENAWLVHLKMGVSDCVERGSWGNVMGARCEGGEGGTVMLDAG